MISEASKFVFKVPSVVSRARRVLIKPCASYPVPYPVTTSYNLLASIIASIRRASDADTRLRSLLHGFADGTASLEDIFQHQEADMPDWNYGRFLAFYGDGLRLSLSDTAFGNIAWCATKGNNYATDMLKQCFEKYTSCLIQILDPTVVLLSGLSMPDRVLDDVQELLPDAQVIWMLHYAHRKGREAEETEFARVRALLNSGDT